MNKELYLGDGAYARFDSGVFTLFTSDGETEANHVVLETKEVRKLIEFFKEVYGTSTL